MLINLILPYYNQYLYIHFEKKYMIRLKTCHLSCWGANSCILSASKFSALLFKIIGLVNNDRFFENAGKMYIILT